MKHKPERNIEQNKNNLMVKFLITFVISMLAPLVLITLLLVSHINHREVENITSSIDDETKRISVFFETLIDNTEDIRIVLSDKSCFYDFYIESYGGANVYIRRALSESTSQSNMVNDILFYSSTTDMFHGGATYPKTSYLSFLTPETQSMFEQTFDGTTPAWIPNYSVHRYGITTHQSSYCLPFEEDDSKQNIVSWVIFHFDSDVIDATFDALRYYDDALFYVCDGTQTVYTSDETVLSPALFATLQSGDTCTVQDQEYYLSIATQEESLLVYTLIPMRSILANSNAYTAIYWLYALISLALGCVVIVVFVRYHYVPIFRWRSSFADLGLNLDLSEKFFQEITTTIQALSDNTSQATKDKAKSQRESLLFKLFNIKFTEQNRKELYDICTLSDIHVSRDCFACVVCSGFDEPTAQTSMILESNDAYDIYEYHYIHSKAIVLLFAMNHTATHIIDEMVGSITSRPALGVRACGVSTIKTDFLNINAAYQEAFLTMNYCFQAQKSSLHFSDIDADTSIETRTILNEATLLKESITEKDVDKIMFAFNLVSASLNTLTDIHVLRIHCFEIATQCLANYHHIPRVKPLDFQNELYSFLNLNAEEVVSPTQTLREILKQIIYEISAAQKAAKPKLEIEHIKTRIQETILDPTFSIKQLAEELETSVSNLSHFFKAKENSNISDYISQLKHEHIKQMLSETSDSLYDIAERVGYVHTSNFIKKFKALEGMTPNQYRAQLKKKNT